MCPLWRCVCVRVCVCSVWILQQMKGQWKYIPTQSPGCSAHLEGQVEQGPHIHTHAHTHTPSHLNAGVFTLSDVKPRTQMYATHAHKQMQTESKYKH